MKGLAIALGFVVMLQVIGEVPAKPQILMRMDASGVPGPRGGPSDIQIEPPEEAEITYDIDSEMIIIARSLQNTPGEDPLAHLRLVSDEAEEDRDYFYHPSFQDLEEVPAARIERTRLEPANSQEMSEPEEDRDHIYHQ